MTELNTVKFAHEHVDDIATDLDELPAEAEEIATVLARVVGADDVTWAGSSYPDVTATCCIYIADRVVRPDDHYSQKELAQQAAGTRPTIQKYRNGLLDVFFEHADEDDVLALDNETVLVLKGFALLEKSGFGLDKLDPREADWGALDALADIVRELDQ